MTPRLIVTTGLHQGAEFILDSDEMTLGRHPSNRIRLKDRSVSRYQCLFKREATGYQIIDTHSYNGTRVNGTQLTQQFLSHGAQITVGDVRLLYLSEDSSQSSISPAQIEDSGLEVGSTIRLLQEEALYSNPERILTEAPQNPRIAHDLNSLLKISTILNSTRGLESLQQQILELVSEVVTAERGAILLVGKSFNEIISLVGYARGPIQPRPVRVSKTIADQVLRTGIPVIVADVSEKDTFSASESLISSKTRSLLCVPLESSGARIGVIYLDSSDPGKKFNEEQLQLVTAIARIACPAIQNARHVASLESENWQLQAETHLKHNMIGDSPRMREVYRLMAQVAPTDARVLISGESGTGKELVAHAIHLNSRRANKPFVTVNCAAFPETLIESEFFGYEKGAFNEARAQKKGLLEVADGGTVFLDEIGELAFTVQAKFLRALEGGEFRRVGGTSVVKVDARFIAATNRDLKQGIEQKTFREDLYHRLNVFPIGMPPLREREGDVLLLANHFVFECNKMHNRFVAGIAPEAGERLLSYAWPGNVRELKNVIERATIISETDLLAEDLFRELSTEQNQIHATVTNRYNDIVMAAKKQAIIDAYKLSGGKHTEAAKILDLHPNHLHWLIRTLGLRSVLKRGNN